MDRFQKYSCEKHRYDDTGNGIFYDVEDVDKYLEKLEQEKSDLEVDLGIMNKNYNIIKDISLEMFEIIKRSSEYLSNNDLNIIGHQSELHKNFINILEKVKEML
jgi:hypothetical protein